jgi:hypothetical protein
MGRETAAIVRLPANAAARRERQLAAKWAREDQLLAELAALRAEMRGLQREVSLDAGYPFTVCREKLERALKARR